MVSAKYKVKKQDKELQLSKIKSLQVETKGKLEVVKDETNSNKEEVKQSEDQNKQSIGSTKEIKTQVKLEEAESVEARDQSMSQDIESNIKSELENIELECTKIKDKTFTWISKILCYSFKNRYIAVHDLMKGICLLNHTANSFTFKHESLCLIDSSLILMSHKITNSLFLAQNDKGVLYMITTERKRVRNSNVWSLIKTAEYNLNQRITSFFSIVKDETKVSDVVCSTCEGSVYDIKILPDDMVKFLTKIQYNVMKRHIHSSEEDEQLLKLYDRGFENGFNGNLISKFFSYDTKEIKKLLANIKENAIVNFNLLSIKMLFS